jgi:hypothetical protein
MPPASGDWVRRKAGSSLITSATLTAARVLRVSAPTTSVGLGATKPLRSMREALTMISSVC